MFQGMIRDANNQCGQGGPNETLTKPVLSDDSTETDSGGKVTFADCVFQPRDPRRLTALRIEEIDPKSLDRILQVLVLGYEIRDRLTKQKRVGRRNFRVKVRQVFICVLTMLTLGIVWFSLGSFVGDGLVGGWWPLGLIMIIGIIYLIGSGWGRRRSYTEHVSNHAASRAVEFTEYATDASNLDEIRIDVSNILKLDGLVELEDIQKMVRLAYNAQVELACLIRAEREKQEDSVTDHEKRFGAAKAAFGAEYARLTSIATLRRENAARDSLCSAVKASLVTVESEPARTPVSSDNFEGWPLLEHKDLT